MTDLENKESELFSLNLGLRERRKRRTWCRRDRLQLKRKQEKGLRELCTILREGNNQMILVGI